MAASKVYIRDALFTRFLPREGDCNPRQRAIEFEEDLFNHAGKRLDWQTVTSGSRYSYTDLATPLLDALRDQDMIPRDGLLSLAYWTPEYNPEYSAFGPHFLHKYMPQGQVLDVCDRGSIAAFAALKITHARMQAAPIGPNAIVLGFEQTTVTRAIDDCLPLPSGASAGAIVLAGKPSERHGVLLDAGIVPDSEVHAGSFRLHNLVEQVCDQHDVDPNRLTVTLPVTSHASKNHRYWCTTRGDRVRTAYAMRNAPAAITSMRLFSLVHECMRGALTQLRPLVLLVDEDVDTSALGWALLEGPHAWREEPSS